MSDDVDDGCQYDSDVHYRKMTELVAVDRR